MPNIAGCTKTICLIGSPVEHSLSPAMHTFSFEQLGVDCVYLAYNVEPNQLEAAVNGMKELGFLGYNVTMPHKTYISRYMDEVSPAAELDGCHQYGSHQRRQSDRSQYRWRGLHAQYKRKRR